MPVESTRLPAVSPVGVGSRQCRLLREWPCTSETNKHCIAIAAQSALIKTPDTVAQCVRRLDNDCQGKLEGIRDRLELKALPGRWFEHGTCN